MNNEHTKKANNFGLIIPIGLSVKMSTRIKDGYHR